MKMNRVITKFKKRLKSGRFKSIRYCFKCKKVTEWKIDKKLLHSRCKKCGGERSARSRKEQLEEYYKNKGERK